LKKVIAGDNRGHNCLKSVYSFEVPLKGSFSGSAEHFYFSSCSWLKSL